MTQRPARESDSLTHSEKLLKGLEHFSTWTNVLIVTSTAGIGWILEQRSDVSGWPPLPSLWCLAASITFGVLTMCQIPAMTQSVSDDPATTIYDLPAYNYLLPWLRIRIPIMYLCWPQHTLFIAGVVLFCARM